MAGRRPAVPNLAMPRTGKPFGRGIVGSVAIHGVVVVLILITGRQVSEGILRSTGDPGSAGGGGGTRVTLVDLPPVAMTSSQVQAQARESPRAVSFPLPTPSLKSILKDEPAVRPLATTVPAIRLGSAGPGRGPGSGGGVGSGEGKGVGSGSGPGREGEGEGGFPPQPRHVLLPPEAPKSLKGIERRVLFWIDELGHVTRVEVEPPIEDGAYRKKFLERMYQFTFHPARTSAGTPVSAHFVIPITP